MTPTDPIEPRKKKLKHREHREARVADDRCPECGGELDTGWECNDCGYDARPIAKQTPGFGGGE